MDHSLRRNGCRAFFCLCYLFLFFFNLYFGSLRKKGLWYKVWRIVLQENKAGTEEEKGKGNRNALKRGSIRHKLTFDIFEQSH